MAANDGMLCPKVLETRTERHWLSSSFNFNTRLQTPFSYISSWIRPSLSRQQPSWSQCTPSPGGKSAPTSCVRPNPSPNPRLATISSRLLIRMLFAARHGHSRHHVRRRCIGNGREDQSERARTTHQCYESRRGKVYTVSGFLPTLIPYWAEWA